ncbi:ABC transporter substrate-binding protein [Variovorax sp. J22R133]|uniref:ABC transporter substrate-binding protein n=1 Tax=Variovorax brevis TaxID=3053503 RepID=UPI0025781081|nr:ABC transporter substrate-binding protein [Variovorax sp. J22R133]MDM0117190.1 ABC transporter substrate-binding protein [Variovorax sp. J22R133]
MTVPPAIRSALMPSGVLRASINLGNPILASWDAGNSRATGVSVDLATELAKRLQGEMKPVVFDAAGKSVTAVTGEQADVGFFAIDPLRGEGLLFTAPYILIEGSYLVREDSRIATNEQVDVEGVRIMVGKGSAYDLYLTRELKNAQIVRAHTSPAVVDEFLAQHADVAAGVRQQLASDAARLEGLRLLPGRFMVIQQAMGTPRSRGIEAANYLSEFVEEMKASGFVADAMARHGIEGAQVAPPKEEG